MPRYVAFLRGVSPLNAKMPELKQCFESAGFEDVRTLLSSGNVAFSSKASKEPLLARRAEAAMQAHLGRTFSTIRSGSAKLNTAEGGQAAPMGEDRARVFRSTEHEQTTAA
jgi:uncharacterized protein (DUF1697 family)